MAFNHHTLAWIPKVNGVPGCSINSELVPGGDVAGTVVQLGDGCTRLQVGDRVWGNRFAIGGGMAEYALGLEEQMGVMPQSMEFADAGTIPIVGGTSLQCLLCLQKPPSSPTTTTTTTANTSSNVAGVGGASGSLCPPLPPSDPLPLRNMTVVITSGSGGTGYLAVQMARALGASKIITAATGARAIGWMQSLGADVVVDYKVRDIFDVLEDNSVDAVYDNYGGSGTADKAMSALRAGGVYLLLPHGDSAGTLSKHPKPGVRQINFGDVDNAHHTTLDMLASLFDSGEIKIRGEGAGAVSGVMGYYDFSQAAEAYTEVARGQVLGKIAIVPGGSI